MKRCFVRFCLVWPSINLWTPDHKSMDVHKFEVLRDLATARGNISQCCLKVAARRSGVLRT